MSFCYVFYSYIYKKCFDNPSVFYFNLVFMYLQLDLNFIHTYIYICVFFLNLNKSSKYLSIIPRFHHILSKCINALSYVI